MTTIADVINQAMVIIDDARMSDEIRLSPALFYRKMSAYVYAATALLVRPPELSRYIYNGYAAPTFDDYSWISTTASKSSATNVSTGKTGYELCSITVRTDGGTSAERYDGAVYDPETGIVTFPIQSDSGIEYDIDFYNDGHFDTLTPMMMRLMALAISIIWYERFTNNWLNMQPKIKDSSFDTVNESSYMEKLTFRMQHNRQVLSDELIKYEQNNAYMNNVPEAWKHKVLL